jgi:kumamolisin
MIDPVPVPASTPTPGYNTQLVNPQVAATAYNFPGNNDGTDGVGQVVAVVQPWSCGYTQQNLTSTFNAYGISGTTVVDYLLDGKTNNPATGSVGTNSEVMLDIAMVAGIVPKATVVVYICNTVQSALNAILYDPQNKGYLPKIVSLSVGGAEGTFATTTADTLLAQAAVLGVTVIAASGDWGPYNGPVGYAYRSYGPNWPASSPYVLSIGGTSLALNSNGSIASEVTWNNNGEDYYITGGNQSTRYAVPSWQTGITLKNYATGISSAPTGRAVPDVAFVGDPNTGFTVYFYWPGYNTNYGRTDGGGTSASAPLWAGLIARINQLTGTSSGFINNKFYTNTVAFNDILPTAVANNNAYLGVGFSTTTGWDACTGWGSPKGHLVYNVIANNGIKVKTASSTWSPVQNISIKTAANTWTTVNRVWTKTASGWVQTY